MADRTEKVPSLTAREHWGRYAAGMAAETGFILGLSAVAYLLGVIAKLVWR